MSNAVRVWLGKFAVDYVETFVGLIPAQLIALVLTPSFVFTSIDQAKVAAVQWAVQLVGPALSALVSAGRRALVNAWPSIKAWLLAGGKSA